MKRSEMVQFLLDEFYRIRKELKKENPKKLMGTKGFSLLLERIEELGMLPPATGASVVNCKWEKEDETKNN